MFGKRSFEKLTRTLSLKLSQTDWDEIEALAKEHKVSMNFIVREAFRVGISDVDQKLERFTQ